LPPLQDRAQLVAGLHGLQKISVFDEKINEKSETVFEVFFVVTRRKRGSLTVFFYGRAKRGIFVNKNSGSS
jgi:hypothetical protein